MNINELRKEIICKGGIIFSEDTLNIQHLLTSAYDLIQAYDLNSDIAKAIEGVFVGESPTYYNQFYGQTKINPEKLEEAEYLFNEDIFSLFNEVSPDGYYFGNTEGDGSCFGFFKIDED